MHSAFQNTPPRHILAVANKLHLSSGHLSLPGNKLYCFFVVVNL